MAARLHGSGVGLPAVGDIRIGVTQAATTTTENSSISPTWFSAVGADILPRYSYTGREFNEASGDYHFRFRTYGPELGQFFTRDPLVSGDPGRPSGVPSGDTPVGAGHRRERH